MPLDTITRERYNMLSPEEQTIYDDITKPMLRNLEMIKIEVEHLLDYINHPNQNEIMETAINDTSNFIKEVIDELE